MLRQSFSAHVKEELPAHTRPSLSKKKKSCKTFLQVPQYPAVNPALGYSGSSRSTVHVTATCSMLPTDSERPSAPDASPQGVSAGFTGERQSSQMVCIYNSGPANGCSDYTWREYICTCGTRTWGLTFVSTTSWNNKTGEGFEHNLTACPTTYSSARSPPQSLHQHSPNADSSEASSCSSLFLILLYRMAGSEWKRCKRR